MLLNWFLPAKLWFFLSRGESIRSVGLGFNLGNPTYNHSLRQTDWQQYLLNDFVAVLFEAQCNLSLWGSCPFRLYGLLLSAPLSCSGPIGRELEEIDSTGRGFETSFTQNPKRWNDCFKSEAWSSFGVLEVGVASDLWEESEKTVRRYRDAILIN